MQTSFLERHAEDILGVYISRPVRQDGRSYRGLIKKAVSSYKYHLTALGKLIVAASLKLKEMTLIPLLRGQLLPA